MNLNFDKFQADVELNSLASKVNTKTEGVEIFSAMCSGKDTSKYGDKVDKVNTYMKAKGAQAVAGDSKAQAELNAIRTEIIEAPLLKRLNVFDFMGNKINVGYNEVVKYKVYNLEGKMSSEQAVNGSFPFASYTYSTRTMETGNITGGVLVDYREFQSGNTDAIQVMNEQVITDMMNKVFYKAQNALYNGVKSASIKNFSEAAGITKVAVDKALKIAKRYGGTNIMGDYSVISQLEDFTGFKTDTAGTGLRFSEAVMEEIRKTGFLKNYRGSNVIEIPNTFNVTKLNTAGDFYDTYLPEGLLYFLIAGELSPLQIGFKGGLQSMTGLDINTKSQVTRYDLEVGTAFINEYAPHAGIVSDSNFAVTK